jgi:hypothetical protein
MKILVSILVLRTSDKKYGKEISAGVHTFRLSRLAPCVNRLHSRNAAARARLSLRTSILSMAPLWHADVAANSAQLLKAARATGFWREASARDAAARWRAKEATRLLKPSKARACGSSGSTLGSIVTRKDLFTLYYCLILGRPVFRFENQDLNQTLFRGNRKEFTQTNPMLWDRFSF